SREDYFGNRAEYFSIESGHRSLEIMAESVVDVRQLEDVPIRDVSWEDCVVQQADSNEGNRSAFPAEPLHAQLTFASPRVPLLAELREYAGKSFVAKRSVVQALVDLNVRIHHE